MVNLLLKVLLSEELKLRVFVFLALGFLKELVVVSLAGIEHLLNFLVGLLGIELGFLVQSFEVLYSILDLLGLYLILLELDALLEHRKPLIVNSSFVAKRCDSL